MPGPFGKKTGRPPGFLPVSSAQTDHVVARHDAFKTYVEPEIEILLRVAKSLTGSWVDAEDLVQDTLIRAYRGIDGFDGAHPRAWLLTILRRTNINSHRRQRPDLAPAHLDLERHRPAFGPAVHQGPEEVAIDRVFDDEVEAALAHLDPRFRTVLVLIDVDQLTYAEVSEVLGIPVGTVMSRLSRARQRVREQLPHNSEGRKR